MSMNMSGSGSGSGRENTCCVERRSFHYCSILGAFFSILEMETSIEASWDIRRRPFPPCLFLSFPFLFCFIFRFTEWSCGHGGKEVHLHKNLGRNSVVLIQISCLSFGVV